MSHSSKTFCILPWIHLGTRSDGRVRQCCRAGDFIKIKEEDANLSTYSAEEIWNSDYMKSLRLQLANGEKPTTCKMCWEDEDKYNRGSRRSYENELWNKRIDVAEAVSQMDSNGHVGRLPVYWDLRLGNKCNLKCVMCNPTNSSLWEKDTTFLEKYEHLTKPRGSFDWANDPHLWATLTSHIGNINELYFSGGEPLMSKQHFELLDEAVKSGAAKDIHLRYDTNGLLLSLRHFELWSKFKSVWLNLSLDGTQAVSEYIRFPFKWNKFMAGCELIERSGLQNLKVNISYSLSNMNSLEYLNFIDWKLHSGFEIIANKVATSDEVGEAHTVDEPRFLSLRCMLPKQKKFIEEQYRQFAEHLKFKSHLFSCNSSMERLRCKIFDFITYMNEEDLSDLYPVFKKYREDLDKSRKTRFGDHFQWMLDYER